MSALPCPNSFLLTLCPPPPLLFFSKQVIWIHSARQFHRLGLSGTQSCGGETWEPRQTYFFERDYIKQLIWPSCGPDDGQPQTRVKLGMPEEGGLPALPDGIQKSYLIAVITRTVQTCEGSRWARTCATLTMLFCSYTIFMRSILWYSLKGKETEIWRASGMDAHSP